MLVFNCQPSLEEYGPPLTLCRVVALFRRLLSSRNFHCRCHLDMYWQDQSLAFRNLAQNACLQLSAKPRRVWTTSDTLPGRGALQAPPVESKFSLQMPPRHVLARSEPGIQEPSSKCLSSIVSQASKSMDHL